MRKFPPPKPVTFLLWDPPLQVCDTVLYFIHRLRFFFFLVPVHQFESLCTRQHPECPAHDETAASPATAPVSPLPEARPILEPRSPQDPDPQPGGLCLGQLVCSPVGSPGRAGPNELVSGPAASFVLYGLIRLRLFCSIVTCKY